MTSAAFKLLHQHSISSLNINIQEYRHIATGARHFHMESEDTNNAFMVAFLTLPEDSTGVPHILEHTALCGSRKFPVRDPFFMMLRRSLNTFMNAFTSSDWTAYPFASQNKKDFNNLLEVYLEAAFFPKLDAMDFAQEGHRLEFAEDNIDSPLEYKGVVFNEMKGALSSPVSRLWQDLQTRLFPTLTYHFNSGGEPSDIPNLTHAELKSFHAKHYHPSNAVFMTYGNFPVAEHQEKIDRWALQEFEKKELNLVVKDEQRYSSPMIDTTYYPAASEEETKQKTHIVIGWLLGKTTDLEESLTHQLISDVLLDNSASPLRYALESTDLGTAPSPLCGYEDSMREGVFACGVEGSDPDKAEAVEKLILSTLEEVAEKGVPQEHVVSMLHQLEFSQREITGGGFPYGLQLMVKALPAALHGGDPISMLDMEPVLESLREKTRNPDFISEQVRKLLDNPHRVRLSMVPDTSLAQQMDEDEKGRLAEIKAKLSEQEKIQILEQAEILKQRQQADEDAEILPKVTRDDIPERIKVPEGQIDQSFSTPVHWYSAGTNGLVYQQLIAPIPALNATLQDYLPLYFACLTELGCGSRNYRENQAYQAATCGGMHAAPSIRSDLYQTEKINSYFVLSGKALSTKQAKMDELLLDTFFEARFDEKDKLREIVAQMVAEREMSITGNGHGLAMTAASAGLSAMGALNHQWNGLQGIQWLKQLDKQIHEESCLEDLANKLGQIHAQISQVTPTLLVVCENDERKNIEVVIRDNFKKPLAQDSSKHLAIAYHEQQIEQAWVTGTQVNFCARAYAAVPQSHPDAAALSILGPFMRNNFLHRTIREQGGAYGGGAAYAADEAAFRFYSYRDPRLTETLDDFDRSIDWLLSEKHEVSGLEEAVLGVISSMDKPGSPAGESISAFFGQLHGRDVEHKNKFRQQVLAVTLADLIRVGEKYLSPDHKNTAIITNKALLSENGSLKLDVLSIDAS